jgi:hypothetical protein
MLQVYGKGNERRLTGHHETANINNFAYGAAGIRACGLHALTLLLLRRRC